MTAPRSAIVTGCSSGIGLAITRALLADGWNVLGISRTAPEGPLPGEYTAFSFLGWDLGQHPADYEQPKHLTGSAPYHPSYVLRDDHGAYDALVHCAAVRGPYGPLEENDPDEWERTIATNLLGTARVVRATLPVLRRSQDARVLLFSGGGAFSPEPGFTAYAASKGGTIALMETLAEELRGSVTVNAVAPGFVATPIHAGTPHEGRSDGGAMGNVVACVRHLLSPDARGLTGKTISVGWDCWSEISPQTVPYFNDSEIWTRTRVKAQEAPCPVGV